MVLQKVTKWNDRERTPLMLPSDKGIHFTANFSKDFNWMSARFFAAHHLLTIYSNELPVDYNSSRQYSCGFLHYRQRTESANFKPWFLFIQILNSTHIKKWWRVSYKNDKKFINCAHGILIKLSIGRNTIGTDDKLLRETLFTRLTKFCSSIALSPMVNWQIIESWKKTICL